MHICDHEKSVLCRRTVLRTERRNRKVNCILRGDSKDKPNLRGGRGVYLYVARSKKKRHEPCCRKDKEMRLSACCSVRVEV
jgi:hypothetical protein